MYSNKALRKRARWEQETAYRRRLTSESRIQESVHIPFYTRLDNYPSLIVLIFFLLLLRKVK